MLRRSRASILAVAALATLAPAGARAQAIGRGFDFERTGRLDSAATLYLSTAHGDPTNLPALLGLERVLPKLGRTWELLPLVQRAMAHDSANGGLRGLLVRVYVALDLPDSAAAATGRWARVRPGDEAPYREWAMALSDNHAYENARLALLAGRTALGRPAAFALELAALSTMTGAWDDAAREWGALVTNTPAQAPTAVAQLADAPAEQREAVVRRLTAAGASPLAARVAAELVLGWGDPTRAWTIFEATLGPPAEATNALRRFADLARAPGTPGAWRVRGLALSRFAGMVPEPVAVRARVDAGQAFLMAGDAVAARAELERVTASSSASPEVQRLAAATLIAAMIRDGQLDSAAVRLRGPMGERLGMDDRAALGLALARALIRQGQLALADSALANDSSLETLAMHGWIALYSGDVGQARAWFRTAGPYAGDRREATERTAMLALIAGVGEEGGPALGQALFTLARGDSVAAVSRLREAADRLPATGGRADVLVLAGQVAAQLHGAEQIAAEVFGDVVRTGGSGAAPPAAELEWARLLGRQGMTSDAVQHLEHLILTYPGSAVVPEARRELQRLKGAIPKS